MLLTEAFAEAALTFFGARSTLGSKTGVEFRKALAVSKAARLRRSKAHRALADHITKHCC
jgi:hypothetical protein